MDSKLWSAAWVVSPPASLYCWCSAWTLRPSLARNPARPVSPRAAARTVRGDAVSTRPARALSGIVEGPRTLGGAELPSSDAAHRELTCDGDLRPAVQEVPICPRAGWLAESPRRVGQLQRTLLNCEKVRSARSSRSRSSPRRRTRELAVTGLLEQLLRVALVLVEVRKVL